jgi:beta-lactamase class A
MRLTAFFSFSLLLLSIAIASCRPELPQAGPDPVDSTTARFRIDLQPVDTTLLDSLRSIELRSGGRLGVAAIHIESGWHTLYRGRETFPMASVAKLPMALAFMRALDAGRFRLDSAVTLGSNDHRPGGSRLFHRVMRGNYSPTLHDLLEAMITESDNTACDFILRMVGGPAAADRLMGELGLDPIDITSYEGDLILRWAGIDPAASDSAWTRERIYAKIEAAGKETWDSARARLVDDPTDAAPPESLARLLVLLQQGKILSRTGTDTLLAIMGRTVTGKGRIEGLLPAGTAVAHKTGTIGSVANDVGIVTLPEGRGHLAIALLVKDSRLGVRSRDQAIASAAALIYRTVMKR